MATQNIKFADQVQPQSNEHRPIEIVEMVENKQVVTLADLKNRKTSYEVQIQSIQDEIAKTDALINQITEQLAIREPEEDQE